MKHSVDKIFRSTYQNHRLLHLVPKQGLPRYIFSFAILITRDALTLFGGDLVTQWCPTLCNPWTVACQASLSMGFPRQEYCSGLPFPPPRDLLDSGVEPRSSAMQADSLLIEPPEKYFVWGALYHTGGQKTRWSTLDKSEDD